MISSTRSLSPFARSALAIALAATLLAGCGGGGGGGGGLPFPIAVAPPVTEPGAPPPPPAPPPEPPPVTPPAPAPVTTSYLLYADAAVIGAAPEANAVLKNTDGALSLSDASFGTLELVADGPGRYKAVPPFGRITGSGSDTALPVIGLCAPDAADPTRFDARFVLLPGQAVRVTALSELMGTTFAVGADHSTGCNTGTERPQVSFLSDGSIAATDPSEAEPSVETIAPADVARLLTGTLTTDGEVNAMRVYRFPDGRLLLISITPNEDTGKTDYHWLWNLQRPR